MAKFDRSLIPEAPDLSFERSLAEAGASPICGIDEAGRGALAGPVAAAAVILPEPREVGPGLKGVRDSKELKPHERIIWSARIRDLCQATAVGLATPGEIDRLGIVPATRLAASRALAALDMAPEHLILDYLFLPDIEIPQTSLIKGDQRSLSVAAASILAKAARDAYMAELDARLPGYDFRRNKGYGTAAHRAALNALGPSPAHRFSFAPLKSRLPRGGPQNGAPL